MPAKKNRSVEWIGGLASMPAYVTGEGEPYRPELLLWLSSEGLVVGQEMGRPGELLPKASDLLQSAIDRPMFGRPLAPGRVRVASPELARVLKAGHPALDVVCAPTPEFDDLLESMREKIDEAADTEQSYLDSDASPAAIAALFHAAAQLFRAKPWDILPPDLNLFSVTIERLGVQSAVLSLIGQAGQSLGFLLFAGIDEFDAFVEASEAMQRGEVPSMPPHLSLHYEGGADLTPSLRREIAEHKWEVAGARGYPVVMAVDGGMVARPPTLNEVKTVEAIALTLPSLVAQNEALSAALDGEDLVRTIPVTTHAGEIEVVLKAPLVDDQPGPLLPLDDVLQALSELEPHDGEMNPRELEELKAQLLRHYVRSPEFKSTPPVGVCEWLMDFAVDYFGVTIAALQPPQLEEILFMLIPRKVSIEASAAGEIIGECRAFYAFLKREGRLQQADGCLRVLGGSSVKKLERALSDSSGFGFAKGLVMAGREAGFDLDSKGIEAFMRSVQSASVPASPAKPSKGRKSKSKTKK